MGENLCIIAGAGSGKTSTLRALAETSTHLRGLYLAYNRTVADEAEGTFPRSTSCATAHALAMAKVGRPYQHRLQSARMGGAEAARIMKVSGPFRVSHDRIIPPAQMARLARQAVERFCLSADEELSERHVMPPPGMDDPEMAPIVRAAVLPWAQKWWADVTRVDGHLKFEHDHYVKMWALTHPQLHEYHFLLFDEAQDAWPAVAQVVSEQRGIQVVVVGDPAQAIYGWRGATDFLSKFDGVRLHLSKSWRFGDAIAGEANKWLTLMGAGMRLVGNQFVQSRVGPLKFPPSAVLCRTNAEAVVEVMDALKDERMVALHGKGTANAIRSMAEAAISLKRGEGTGHPELFAFRTWGELQLYVEEENASDLKVWVDLIDAHTPERVIETMDALVEEDMVLAAQREGNVGTVVATAHKAKGGQWPTVRIAQDFREPDRRKKLIESELKLAYVAVTRAEQWLDRGSLDWIDYWIKAEQRAAAAAAKVAG